MAIWLAWRRGGLGTLTASLRAAKVTRARHFSTKLRDLRAFACAGPTAIDSAIFVCCFDREVAGFRTGAHAILHRAGPSGAADREENGMKDDKSNSKAGIG